MPSEAHARRFLERLVWPTGRYCPHCGSTASTPLRGRACRPGLYQCRDCRLQFSVTTKTPMHATKLDLRLWVCAIFLVITSSKGISSVVMARLLGVNQKTAWKMGHAIRELMDDRDHELLPLDDIVEVDEGFVGGAPKSLSGAYHPRGKGTSKPMVFVAASRHGQARARVVPDDQITTLEPILREWVVPDRTTLMTDGGSSYPSIGKKMASHHRVIHSQQQYADPETGAHVNTAESVISQVERALVGVYHNLREQHLQRYLDEIVWRWNHREPASEHCKQWTSKSGKLRSKTTVIWKPIPVVPQMERLLGSAVAARSGVHRTMVCAGPDLRFFLVDKPERKHLRPKIEGATSTARGWGSDAVAPKRKGGQFIVLSKSCSSDEFATHGASARQYTTKNISWCKSPAYVTPQKIFCGVTS